MNYALTIGLTDRSQTNAVVADLKSAAARDGFSMVSAEETDAIGMIPEDVILNIVISFGTSIAAELALVRINALISSIKQRRTAVRSTTVHPVADNSQTEDQAPQ